MALAGFFLALPTQQGEAPAFSRLLAWFDREKRALPWRDTRDPYRILVSEVMLQQTRVETVVPYFERFLERFPTLRDLARAEIDEVLAAWSGLGYYGRARRLHATARAVEAGGGAFPQTAAGLEALPGIGPYTAAAVASIAFGDPVPVLDGNAIRVLSRLEAFEGDATSAAGRRRLVDRGRCLLDAARPGDSNQALMELGATVCLSKKPRCAACPLESDCRAAAGGEPERYPLRRKRRAVERHRLIAALVERDGRYLLCRRPGSSSLLAGTWEVPWGPAGEEDEVAASLAGKYGGAWEMGERMGEVRHTITYRALEVEVRRAARRAVPPSRVGERWLAPHELEGTAASSLVRKILRFSGV